MYKWDWITETEALLQSASIERKQLYLLGLPRKREQPWIFNKLRSMTELPRKLNLVTTACTIYDLQLGCDTVFNVLRRFNVVGNTKTYLGVHVKCSHLLTDFNRTWIFSTDVYIKEIRPMGAALIHADRRAN